MNNPIAQNQEQPISEQRFVLYARKSTEDEGSQVNSIEDQIKKCKEYAEKKGIHIVSIIKEEKSAKRSGNRPKFDAMIAGFPSKYDGLIAWHPDRLARNMREAGVVIDMLTPDVGLIKTLMFPTVEFNNDSGGRLTLAMLFSLATQYSEHLSEQVKRGVDSGLAKGRSSGTPKWGYNRSEITSLYEPDDNFAYIKAGWDMRADGATLDEIVEYWRRNDVHRVTKINKKNKKKRAIYINKNSASKIFSDPFYYGILCQAEQEVDLRLVVPSFKPMVTEEQYNKVQALRGEKYRRQLKLKKRANFYPLRNMVRCSECGHMMVVGPSTSRSGKKILYFRCDNKECLQKSVRARVIFDQLYDELDKLKFSEKDYKVYAKTLTKYTDEVIAELRSNKRSLMGQRNQLKAQQTEKSRSYAELSRRDANTPQNVLETLRSDIEDLQTQIIDIEAEIGEVEAKIGDPDKLQLTKDEFLNLVNNVADKMRNGTALEKDQLCRILFLNLAIGNEKTLSCIWKEPFATLAESRKINSGLGDRT